MAENNGEGLLEILESVISEISLRKVTFKLGLN